MSHLENEVPDVPAAHLPEKLNDFLPSRIEEKYAKYANKFKTLLNDASTSEETLTRYYRSRLFPLAQQRIVARRLSDTCFDVLYLTAGTQPYSQTLSVLATPAKKVVFIATDAPKCRECVKAAIRNACIAPEDLEVLTFREPFSPSEFARVLYFHHKSFPPGTRFAADITSGRKSMSAALSGFALTLHIPQFYLHAEYARNFAVNEERQSIPEISESVEFLRRSEEATEEEGE